MRLGDDVIKRLDAVSERIGSNRASVIRMLINTWLDDFDRDGSASLPPDWEQLMNQLDGRTSRATTVEPMLQKQNQNSIAAEDGLPSVASQLPLVKPRYPAGKSPRKKK